MIKRYTASSDTTITNAYDSSLIRRGTNANMGASDSLEVFYICGQAQTGSMELSRVLIKFETDKMQADRTSGVLPESGAVNFYLNLFNVAHASTLASDCALSILPVSASWTEGPGLDMEEYQDRYASNWFSASNGVSWVAQGGDFLSSPAYSYRLSSGIENLSVDITNLVEGWITGSISNHGVCVKLSGSYETGSQSYYTKKFSARGTEYFFSRPTIEARWNSSSMDDRNNFFASSSAAGSAENTNTLLFRNNIRGNLVNIPAFETGTVLVHLDSSATTGSFGQFGSFTASKLATGLYSVSVYAATTASTLYDRWVCGSVCYHTGTVHIRQDREIDQYFCKLSNLKPEYSNNEIAKLRLFTRGKNWHPTVYTKASQLAEPDIIPDLHFCVIRPADNTKAIDYDMTVKSTKLSYDASGSFFQVDSSLLEPDYAYEIRFKTEEGTELQEKFRFRVRKDDE